MKTRRQFLAGGLAVSLPTTIWAIAPQSSLAYDGCRGIVRGLSNNYNLARGSGFLAVRTRPTTRSRMRDQLFNGDSVQIFGRRGNWYQISYSGGSGWVYARYVRNECDY